MKTMQNQACSKPGCETFGKPGINIGVHGWFTTKSGRQVATLGLQNNSSLAETCGPAEDREMRRIRCIMATTHLDRHNERLTLAALESMQEYSRSSFLPFIVNHDPRSAPIGRVIDTEITDLPDGEHALEAEIEVFESGPLPPLRTDRSMPFRELPRDSLVLTIDRSFSRPEFQDAVGAIAQEFGTPVQFESKKALDPVLCQNSALLE